MKLVNVSRPVYRTNPVDSLLNDFFKTNLASDRLEKAELAYSPSTNVLESETEIALELLIPGFSKDQIELAVENNVLTVKSELNEDKDADAEEAKTLKYSRIEFEKRNFEKKFRLSDKLNQEEIHAEVNNGILKITIQKKKEAIPVKRQIEIA
ncbi:Hsp20/alpha crystallin family protein [Sunxiuqinia dokdonensis]|uniref:Hsp20/alpha crystallin family protein n=1 Tax=Sunxiuqinia dokdonensis TaxID=1409788 RepID=UPI0009E69F55|nr:Hsp20/alpha crystallin family protein [Sunxiuqinia dokdonensis]